MDLILQLFKVVFSLIKIMLLKVFFFRGIKLRCIPQTSSCPSIRIRGGGFIELGNVKFRKENKLFADGGRIQIGDKTFFNHGCSINSKSSISIGKNNLFGEGVKIYDHNHKLDGYSVSAEEFDVKAIHIGNNCWIGSNCIILPGVNICDNVTIGAGSIVTKSINQPGVYVIDSVNLRKLK